MLGGAEEDKEYEEREFIVDCAFQFIQFMNGCYKEAGLLLFNYCSMLTSAAAQSFSSV
jgi:hypothetical protein